MGVRRGCEAYVEVELRRGRQGLDSGSAAAGEAARAWEFRPRLDPLGGTRADGIVERLCAELTAVVVLEWPGIKEAGGNILVTTITVRMRAARRSAHDSNPARYLLDSGTTSSILAPCFGVLIRQIDRSGWTHWNRWDARTTLLDRKARGPQRELGRPVRGRVSKGMQLFLGY